MSSRVGTRPKRPRAGGFLASLQPWRPETMSIFAPRTASAWMDTTVMSNDFANEVTAQLRDAGIRFVHFTAPSTQGRPYMLRTCMGRSTLGVSSTFVPGRGNKLVQRTRGHLRSFGTRKADINVRDVIRVARLMDVHPDTLRRYRRALQTKLDRIGAECATATFRRDWSVVRNLADEAATLDRRIGQIDI